MKFIILAAVVALAAASQPLVPQTMVDEINKMNTTWKAANNRFADYTVADARVLLGTDLKANAKALNELPQVNTVVDVPDSFDSRQEWPGSIHPIRNQEQCGSCWAFAATEALSDRFSIQSKNSVNVVLSPQDLVSCDNQDGNMGCNGGYPIKAWQYMQSTGVVSDECYPYTSGGGVTGNCQLSSGSCPGSGSYKLYNAKSAYSISPNVAAIQSEIYQNGPIEVAFEVYQDFFSYSGGVYQHKTGGLAGGHAVKMIGWGSDSGTPYWLVANSWGESWGLDGFFMILRGSDECGIESQGVAGLASV